MAKAAVEAAEASAKAAKSHKSLRCSTLWGSENVVRTRCGLVLLRAGVVIVKEDQTVQELLFSKHKEPAFRSADDVEGANGGWQETWPFDFAVEPSAQTLTLHAPNVEARKDWIEMIRKWSVECGACF